ncbi:MAG: FKBP-type peptidyl-prolyl cis-trans isomerase [Elusimicrobiota bacterium]
MQTLLLLALSVAAQESQKAPAQELTEHQKTLYAVGVALGRNATSLDIKPEELPYLVMGLEDTVTGRAPKASLQEYGPKIEAMGQERQVAKGKAFLTEAAAEKGAKKTASGLVFKRLSAGKGGKPKASDTVKVHYRGTLVNGREFDSSYRRGEPAEFPLNGVIKCWTEGLQLMQKGEKAQLVCPSDIAYGSRGSSPVIPPDAVLVFEVELLDIVKK